MRWLDTAAIWLGRKMPETVVGRLEGIACWWNKWWFETTNPRARRRHVLRIVACQPVVHFRAAFGFIDARSKSGATLLMRAARYGNLDQVRRLIDRGADVNARDGEGHTALSHACERWGMFDNERWNHWEPKDGLHPLYPGRSVAEVRVDKTAARMIIPALLEAGASPNVQAGGYTPLHVAAANDNTKIATALLDRGAYRNARAKDHLASPLHTAVDSKALRVAQLLIDRGTNIHAKVLHQHERFGYGWVQHDVGEPVALSVPEYARTREVPEIIAMIDRHELQRSIATGSVVADAANDEPVVQRPRRRM